MFMTATVIVLRWLIATDQSQFFYESAGNPASYLIAYLIYTPFQYVLTFNEQMDFNLFRRHGESFGRFNQSLIMQLLHPSRHYGKADIHGARCVCDGVVMVKDSLDTIILCVTNRRDIIRECISSHDCTY